MTNTKELLHQLKSAAQEEIMCREASDIWQDLASPENILALTGVIDNPVLKGVNLPQAKVPQFIYHGGKGAFDAGKDAGFNEALLLCVEALCAAGYTLEGE